jgi:recombination protein RecA
MSRFDDFSKGDLLKQFRKKWGKGIMQAAPDFDVSLARIPAEIFEFDRALGGGWPVGRFNIIYGDKSCGKTAVCLKSLASAQKRCANCWSYITEEGCVCGDYREPICAYLDVEGTWNEAWAKALGVDTDKLLLSIPDHAEQALDMSEALLDSGDVDFVVLDSIAFLTPIKEIEESSGKALQAEQARTLGRGIRKFVSAINRVGNQTGRRPTVLCTNQIRMKLGVMFGNPETQSGGRAPGYAATTEVKCWGAKYEMDKATGTATYVNLSFRVEKNKASGAKMQGEWRLMVKDDKKLKGQTYDEPALVLKGISSGLVEKAGNGWLCLGEKFKSKDVMVDRLIADLTWQETYQAELLKILA